MTIDLHQAEAPSPLTRDPGLTPGSRPLPLGEVVSHALQPLHLSPAGRGRADMRRMAERVRGRMS